ncbi:MAG: hypothetical protein FJ134_02555 [Deltaproteobacteria bacterium]|nr:hypothetical protein [Deltaproteobacteria bacterium]
MSSDKRTSSMFNGFAPRSITVHWLSGFDQSRFETWMAKKASITLSPTSLSFRAYIIWPVEEADECKIEIRKTENGITFEADWFPGEEFETKMFFSPDKAEMVLMASYERETVFVHLE